MNLSELRDAFRIRADDTAKPYLWSDDEVDFYLNEAEQEACVRAKLIKADGFELSLTAGEREYALPASVIEIRRAKLSGGAVLTKTSAEVLDATWPDWEQATGTPDRFIDAGDGITTLVPAPTTADTLSFSAYRLPLNRMVNDSDAPEIHARYHHRMLDWALRCAYLKHDADAFDQDAADLHEDMFERSFGYSHTANVQRKHRDKRLPAVKSGW